MLNESLSQPKIFLFLMLTGFLCGFIFDFFAFLKFSAKKKGFLIALFDFLAMSLVLIVLYLVVLFKDYGKLRIYHLIAFFLAFFLERYTVGKLIVKLFELCYNLLLRFFETIGKIVEKIKCKRTKIPPDS